MSILQSPIGSEFGFKSTADDVAKDIDLTGKFVVITGGHSGIGLETTRVLAEKGARVIVGARDMAKAKKALSRVANVEATALDLSQPQSIDKFAQEILSSHKKIDILINNAGVMALPESRDVRGYEMQFATNHLGHFQLTYRLFDALKSGPNTRVITLSSAGHRFSPVDLDDPNFISRPYDKWKAYGQSKSANSLFAVELDRRMRDHGIRSFAVHPGRVISTDLARHMEPAELAAASNASPALSKDIPQGAATTVWAATNRSLEGMGGVYCADCEIAPLVTDVGQHPAGVLSWAVDHGIARALWELSNKMIQQH